jgi:hypothetical protein
MNRILDKLTSGRWLLSVLMGWAFLYMVVTQTIGAEAALPVILLVVNWYFERRDRKNDKDTK